MKSKMVRQGFLVSEKELYILIEDMFMKRGYFAISSRVRRRGERVHSAFAVNLYGAARQIDVVAFRTRNGEIEAKAVECKPGPTWEAAGEALGQATAYQRLFPEVYVATQAVEEDLKHVESILRDLGLGYISIRNGKAEEVFPPSRNVRFNRAEFELQVKVPAIALLGFRDVLGDNNMQFGRAHKPGEIWVSSLEPCNVSCSIESGEGIAFWFCLNIESKPVVNRVFSAVDANHLHKIFSELPSGYGIGLAKFQSYRPKRYEKETLQPLENLSPQDLASCVNEIREWNWKAHVQVGKTVSFEVPSTASFASELRKAVDELSPLQSYLNSLA